ncbi:hypothetical protein QFC21_000749 [Naganishia friedmannii]|uniref:Uncharacterized protein n=1 Tax=Naganishia friedmannii TaxID=89922 RepID=A0ACC2W7Z0_9TREE|nr:hypothetical protein QFC21_000749 [Naganishia friedmannii]
MANLLNLGPGDGMNQDNETDANMDGEDGMAASFGKTAKAPLRRGDACLFCRKRKLRCDALKPSCNQCIRARRELCEYDQGKPKSKVKILEAKIAELESQMSNPQQASSSGFQGASEEGFQQPMTGAYLGSMNHGYANMTTYASGNLNTAYAHPPFNLGAPYTVEAQQQQYRPAFQSTSSAELSGTPPIYGQQGYDIGSMPLRSGVNLTTPRHNSNSGIPDVGPSQRMTDGQRAMISTSTVAGSWPPVYETPIMNVESADQINQAQSYEALAAQNSGIIEDLNAIGTDFIDEFRKTITPDHPLYVSGLSELDLLQAKSILEAADAGQALAGMTPQTQNLMDTLFAAMRPMTPHGGIAQTPASGSMQNAETRRDERGESDQYRAGTSSTTPSFDFSTLDPSMEAVTGSVDEFNLNNLPSWPAKKGTLQERYQPRLPTDVILPDSSHALYRPVSRVQNMGDPSSASEYNLSAGWYDPLDLPQKARDELLRIFFDTATIYMLGMNIARFKTRLTLPANKRPHPCWLYGMYLYAARYSDDPAIRNLEGHFYEIANTQFEIALQNADRLLDAIRGAHLVSVYCYSRGKYLQPDLRHVIARHGSAPEKSSAQTPIAIDVTRRRLSMAAGLHAIESNNFVPPTSMGDRDFDRPSYRGTTNSFWAIPPPEDPVDLSERISTFWMVWYLDRAGSIAMRWPAGFNVRDINTPFAATTPDTTTFDLNPVYDERLTDLLRGINKGVVPGLPIWSMLTRAMALLHDVALSVRTPCTRQDGSFDTPGGSSATTDVPEEPRLRFQNPEAFRKLDRAITAFVDSFPPEMLDPVRRSNGRKVVDIYIISLHSFVACAQMWLHDSEDWHYENPEALEAARRVLTLGRLVPEDRLFKLDLYLPMFWAWAGKVLIRELRRLENSGDYLSTVALEAELDMMVERLKALGKSVGLADLQAERVQQWREGNDSDEGNDDGRPTNKSRP